MNSRRKAVSFVRTDRTARVEGLVDANRFDQRVREWSAAGTRRWLLRFLAGVPLVGLLATRLREETEAGRRRRRKARHHKDKHKHKDKVKNQRKGKGKGKGKGKKDKKKRASPCLNAGQTPRNGKRCCPGLIEDGSGICVQPSPPPPPPPSGCATTCSGCCAGETCITATSAQRCGRGGASCAPCAVCQRCSGAGQCVPDTSLNGTCCPAGVCQDGSCDSGPCEPCSPVTCPDGCCAGDTCQIDADTACGTGGGICIDCTPAGKQCQGGQCVCVPISCPGNSCGSINDGCGGTIPCGDCQNPTPICVVTTCEPCSEEHPCPSGTRCQSDGSCMACDVCLTGCPFTSIQEAIDAPTVGPTITICPGAYTERITISRDLTLIGSGSGAGVGDTVLDAAGSGRVVTIDSGVNVDLRGMRITGGAVTGDGGGIQFLGDGGAATLTMTDCVVIANSASHGAGIFNFDGAVSMTNCVVRDNAATGDGGGIYTSLGTVTLNDSSVADNDAVIAGGGIYSNVGTVTLDDSSVTGNSVTGDLAHPGNGGGIYNVDGAVTLIRTSSVTANTADTGGGIFSISGTVRLNDSHVTANAATGNGGGGIHMAGGTLELSSGSGVTDNDAAINGGGIWNLGALTLDTSIVTANTAGNDGGGIYNAGTSVAAGDVLLSLSHVRSNTAANRGGGVFNARVNQPGVIGAKVTLDTSSTVEINDADPTPGSGGGIFNEGTVTMINGLVESNEPDQCVDSGAGDGCP